MANEPTLYAGYDNDAGWVEYLQNLLLTHGVLDNTKDQFTWGEFDNATLEAVKEFQTNNGLSGRKGIVGDQTWSALRGEASLREPGDDGLAPGTYRERGLEMRFMNIVSYDPTFDRLDVQADSVGSVHPDPGTIELVTALTTPDGRTVYPASEHSWGSTDGSYHDFKVGPIVKRDGVAGPPGLYSFQIQLPQDTGGDWQTFQFNLRDDGSIDEPTGP